jgi:hypothetical protein
MTHHHKSSLGSVECQVEEEPSQEDQAEIHALYFHEIFIEALGILTQIAVKLTCQKWSKWATKSVIEAKRDGR